MWVWVDGKVLRGNLWGKGHSAETTYRDSCWRQVRAPGWWGKRNGSDGAVIIHDG